MSKWMFWICVIGNVLLTCFQNTRLVLFWVLAALGGCMNLLVIAANGYRMPVIGRTEPDSGKHKPADASTRYLWLADRRSCRGASPGDMLIAIGTVMYFVKFLYLAFKGVL